MRERGGGGWLLVREEYEGHKESKDDGAEKDGALSSSWSSRGEKFSKGIYTNVHVRAFPSTFLKIKYKSQSVENCPRIFFVAFLATWTPL